MDLGKTATDALTGAATGIVGGPIGMAVGLLTGIAPDLLSLFEPQLQGTQAETVARQVVSAVATATGIAAPAADSVIGLDPAAAANLKVQLATIAMQAAGQQNAADKAVLDARLAEMQAQYADLASAREHDIAISAKGRNWRADMMLGIVGVGLVVCIVAAAVGNLNQAALGMVLSISGILAGCFKDAFGFEFGSSRSSETKTDLLAKSVPASMVAGLK